MVYRCPICGKTFATVKEVAECVQKCSVEVEKKEKEIESLNTEITKTYNKLKGLVNEFNTISSDSKYTCNLKKNSEKELKEINNPKKFDKDFTFDTNSLNFEDFKKKFEEATKLEKNLSEKKKEYGAKTTKCSNCGKCAGDIKIKNESSKETFEPHLAGLIEIIDDFLENCNF